MRTLVDIPEDDLQLLTELSKTGKVSRAELVRQAIAVFLASHRKDALDEAFGLWAKDGAETEDGLAYQQRIRAEWDR